MKFPQILRSQRKLLGLTQRDLADTLGIKDVNVSDWERGKGMPEASRLPALAKRLGMSISGLMGDAASTHAVDPSSQSAPLFEPRPEHRLQLVSPPRNRRLQWVEDDEAEFLSQYRACAQPERAVAMAHVEALPKAVIDSARADRDEL